MDRLIDFPLEEPRSISRLRAKTRANIGDDTAQTTLGLALAGQGCTYEAAFLLRPRRKTWKSGPNAPAAKAALEAQTWWNKNWRDFAHLKQAGNREGALALLGCRAIDYWDLPSLLVHLGGFAAETERFDLAEHLFRRVNVLVATGLPKMDMTAFAYVGAASLVEVLARRGKFEDALAQHRVLTPNPGNAMAHEIQLVRLLARTDRTTEAFESTARMLVTALSDRKGYSREMRIECADKEPDLAQLRAHEEWSRMRADPKSWLKARKA